MKLLKMSWSARPVELPAYVEAKVHGFVDALSEADESRQIDTGDPFEFLLGPGAPVEADRENLCDMDPVDEGELCQLEDHGANEDSAFANDVRLSELMNGATVNDVVMARIPHAEESLLRAIAEGASRIASANSEVVEASPKASGSAFMLGHMNDGQRLADARLTPGSVYDDLYRQIDAYCDEIRVATDQLANREQLTVESFRDGLRAMKLVVNRFNELLNSAKAAVLDQTAKIVHALSMDSYSALERTRRMAYSMYLENQAMGPVGHRPLTSVSFIVRLDMATCGVSVAVSEYCSSTRSLSFAPGECLRTVKLPLIDDPIGVEADELFGLALLTPTEGSCKFLVDRGGSSSLPHRITRTPLETLKSCLDAYRPFVHAPIHSKLVSRALVAGASENSTVVAKSNFDNVRIYKMRRWKDVKRHVANRQFDELSGDGTVVAVDTGPSFVPSAGGAYIVGTEIVVRCLDGGHFFLSNKKG